MTAAEPRVPPLPAEQRDERTEELLEALRFGGRDLNIFATLARHPRILKRWSAFGGVLLNGSLPARDRELLILRTGWRCRSAYEWGQHVLLAREAGLSDDDIARVAAGPDDPGWDDGDRLLLRVADELHDTATLGDPTWEALAARYDDPELIEVCMLVGQYHLVSFTLNALRVQPEPGLPPLPDTDSR